MTPPFSDVLGASRCLAAAVALLLLALAGPSVTAQPIPTGGAAVYRHAHPGQAVISVHVWGAVRQPGWYEVGPGTGLDQILSLAGGPVVGAEDPREERRVNLTLTRGAEHAVVFATTLDALMASGPAPALAHGDVLMLQTTVRPRFTWRDGLGAASAVGGLLVALARGLYAAACTRLYP